MLKYYLITLMSLFFISCSAPYNETPKPINFKSSTQYKLQDASHWKIISKDISKLIVASLNKNKIKSLYISPNNSTPFNKAFYNFLMENLLNKNITINTKINDFTLKYNVDVIYFSRANLKNRNFIGVPTLLGAGVWGAREYALHHNPVNTAAVGTIALVTGIELYNWFNSKNAAGAIPHYEVIINIQVYNKNRFITNINKIYFIEDNDIMNYIAPKKTPKYKIEIKGK